MEKTTYICGHEKRKVRRGGRTFLFAKTAEPVTHPSVADRRSDQERLSFFLLGDSFLRNFLFGFLCRFLLSCFLFCHGLDHLLSSVLNCDKELGFSDKYTVLSSNIARSLEAFYGSMRPRRRSTRIKR